MTELRHRFVDAKNLRVHLVEAGPEEGPAVEFERTGFRGGLNWYRCADATWELSRAWDDKRIEQPALSIAGEHEPVLVMQPGAVEAMARSVPGLRRTLLLPGCGHWTQQERPAEVSATLLEFLAELAPSKTGNSGGEVR